MKLNRITATVIGCLTVAAVASAQPEPTMRRILLPAYTADVLSGQGGAKFRMQLEAYSDHGFRYYPGRATAPQIISGPAGRYIFTVPSYGRTNSGGRFLFVNDGPSPTTNLSLRLLSGHTTPTTTNPPEAVTTMPLVHDNDFVSGRTVLVNAGPVSANSGFRQTLRIYGFDDAPADFDVKLWLDVDSGYSAPVLVGTKHISLDTKEGNDVSFPRFAQLDLGTFPSPCGGPIDDNYSCDPRGARVEIVPTSAATKYWPLLTITNSSTLQVTLAYPQQ